MTSTIKTRLRDLKSRYGGDEPLAAALRDVPGFQGISRQTIFRWTRIEGEALPPRARLAVTLLEQRLSRHSGEILRVAHPKTLLTLPSALACSPARNGVVRITEERGISATVTSFESGGDALAALEDGKADIAIAALDLMTPHRSRAVTRLCSIAAAPVVAIARQKVSFSRELQGKKLACPAKSAIPLIIAAQVQAGWLPHIDLIHCADPRAAAKALQAGQVDGVVAWDEFLLRVLRALRGKQKPAYLPEAWFGTLRQGVAVNLDAAPPTAVRCYVECLTRITEELSHGAWTAPRLKREFNNEAMKETQPKDLTAFLRNATFAIADLNPEAVLALWKREIESRAT